MKITFLIDCAYLSHEIEGLRNFMAGQLQRELGNADLAYWLDCLALDAGARPGDNLLQVIFLHAKDSDKLEGFTPSLYKEEIDGKAFRDNLGEFEMKCAPVEELVNTQEMLQDCIDVLQEDKENIQDGIVVVSSALIPAKGYTLCSMTATSAEEENGINLGYSLLAALGINPCELR